MELFYAKSSTENCPVLFYTNSSHFHTEETPNSAALHLADEFQNKARLLDSDFSRKAGHVSIVKRRLRPKRNDGRDDILKGWSLQLERAKSSFLSVYVVCMAIFIIFSLLFVGVWRGL